MLVACLLSSAAQTFVIESSRAPAPSANVLHGVVPAVGTSALSVPSLSRVNFSMMGVRSQRRPLQPWSEFGDENPPFQRRSPLLPLKLGHEGTRP